MDLSNNSDTKNAFQWWNSQIENCFDLDNPPQIVPAKIATSIFYKIFPTLMIFDEFNDNDQAYWGEIHRFLICRFSNIEIPNPSLDFPKFIIDIYKLKEKINPSNLTECFEFLQSYQTAQPAFFLLRQYPVIINNPILYFETIINFSKYNKQLWLTIIKEYRFFDNFFYMNKNYFNHFPKSSKINDWTTILLCSSAFSKVLSSSLEYHTHAFNHSMQYIKEVSKYFEIIPDEVFTSLLLDIISVIKSSYQKVTLRDKLELKICELLRVLIEKESHLIKFFVKFLISYEPNIVSKTHIVHYMTQDEIRSISDIEILTMVCDSTTAYDILVFLSQNMIQSKIFHRSCSSFILEIIKQYDKNESIVEYSTNFIQGLFIFISLAKKIQKYKTRTLFICESMNLYMQSNIFWLQNLIMECSSTVAQIGYFPCYFDLLFPISFTKDSNFGNLLTSTNKIKRSKIKSFPFNQTKDESTLFNINNSKNKKVIKRIDDCVESFKILKTKTKAPNTIHLLGEELRTLLVLQVKYKHMFPNNFDNTLLYFVKTRNKVNIINLYQLIRVVLFFIDDSNFSRVIDFLNFGIETKTFNSIYELAIITKKYGVKYAKLASYAIDRLIELELNSTWAIQTYRRIIKNTKLKNELVSVIVLSSLSSEDEFIKIEAIKTLPYILYNDINEVAIYKNLKCDLISSNNKILFIASKSLTNTICNNVSCAKDIFSRLIKNAERLKSFEISFPLFLKHFNIKDVLNSLNDWALFLLNLNDSLKIQHISIVSKIVIKSFVSILGENCQMTKILLKNVKDEITDKQAVIILNSFTLCHSSSKFVLNNEKIFFDALKNDHKEIQTLSIQCFELFTKNDQSLGLTFLKKIIAINDYNNLSFYQAEALILKHVFALIDEETLNSIIDDNSINNIIPLSFLSKQQIPEKIYDIEKDDNIFNKILKGETNMNDYLLLFMLMHQKNISQKAFDLLLKNLIDQFETLSNLSLIFIYQISMNDNNQEISKFLAEKSLDLLIKIHGSQNYVFDDLDEFNRKYLYNISPISFSDDFSTLILENNEQISHILYKQITTSFNKLISNIKIDDRISIIRFLFESIIPTPDESPSNKNWPIMANLSLIEQIICNEFKLQMPPNGLSILLVLQRNRKNADKIACCISKWIQLFPDSLDICFNSFIYSDPMMFSYFLKYYSSYLNEYAVEAFFVQLKIHFDSNPLILMKAIPYFIKNKFVNSEMKISLFTIIEELLSYDFLVRPETIRDFYEAMCSFSNMIFSKSIMSLLHFPLNSSTATYFGIKMLRKINDKTSFFPILDEIINKNDVLNNDCIQNSMNNKILFEALKIRNSIENIPLILLLYQQTNDELVANLIKKTFELSPEVSQWTYFCKQIIINKTLPTKFDEKIKPSFLLTKMMLLISKKLVPRIRETYPFQTECIETIFEIALKVFSNRKHQKKASSILSEIIERIGDLNYNDDFVFNQFCSIIKNIESVANDIDSFENSQRLVFTMIDYFTNKGNQKLVSNLVQIVNNNLKLINNDVIYLRISSFLYHLSNDFIIPSNFEAKATEFIRLVFDKKCFLRNLKGQLSSFVEILIKHYPKIIPIKILKILIIEEIYHKCKDYLLLAFSVIVDAIQNEISDLKAQERNSKQSTINKKLNNSSSTNIELSSANNDSESTENNIKLNDTNESNAEINNDNESTENNIKLNDTNKSNTEINNDNESTENNIKRNESTESNLEISNDNESTENNIKLNDTNESNTEINNDNESTKNNIKLNDTNESNTEINNDNESTENNIKRNESTESNLEISNDNESTESSLDLNNNDDSVNSSNTNNIEDIKNNQNKNTKIVSSSKNAGNELTVDEITLVLSKVEYSNFVRGIGYRCFITSIARLIPNSIGYKWKNIMRILITSSISSPLTVNFECISYILQNARFRLVNEYIPVIFRSVSLSKMNENENDKICELISLIFEKQTPQIIEALLADLILTRPYDRTLILKVMQICFEILSAFSITNSVVINYLKNNFFDFVHLSFIENLLSEKKTEKQAVLFVIHLIESISNDSKNVELIDSVVVKMMSLFELLLKKAALLIRKKDLKKIQADVLHFVLFLAPKINDDSKPAVSKLIKCIPKEIVAKDQHKMKKEEIDFLSSLENC